MALILTQSAERIQELQHVLFLVLLALLSSLCRSLPAPPLPRTRSHLAFSPRASLSVSESADATEKRGEVNSLSPCFINNVTQRLTEWVWMAAGIKRPEYFPPNPSTLAPQPDLFKLGDKFSSDLAAVFIFCLLTSRGLFLLLVPHLCCSFLAELGSIFLSKSHVIALPSTCVLVYKISVCVCIYPV